MKKDIVDNVMDNPIYEQNKRFFDKRDKEEECLYEFDDEIQMRYEEIEKIYDQIITHQAIETAKDKSLKERIRLGWKENDDFVYGEMTFRSLAYIYETIKKSFGPNCFNPGSFYDLGSGHGQVLVQAALLHPFKSCVGIEILDPLHKMALKTKIKYDKEIKNEIMTKPDLFKLHNKYTPEFRSINGSFFDLDWNKASMVFTNSTCFNTLMMEEVFIKAKSLEKGAYFINTSQKMPKKYQQHWQYLTPFSRLMSWGVAKIFIYRRK